MPNFSVIFLKTFKVAAPLRVSSADNTLTQWSEGRTNEGQRARSHSSRQCVHILPAIWMVVTTEPSVVESTLAQQREQKWKKSTLKTWWSSYSNRARQIIWIFQWGDWDSVCGLLLSYPGKHVVDLGAENPDLSNSKAHTFNYIVTLFIHMCVCSVVSDCLWPHGL